MKPEYMAGYRFNRPAAEDLLEYLMKQGRLGRVEKDKIMWGGVSGKLREKVIWRVYTWSK